MGCIRSQICGGLAEIYREMRIEEAQDYESFEIRVKQRFGLTGEHHRRELRKKSEKNRRSLHTVWVQIELIRHPSVSRDYGNGLWRTWKSIYYVCILLFNFILEAA